MVKTKRRRRAKVTNGEQNLLPLREPATPACRRKQDSIHSRGVLSGFVRSNVTVGKKKN
jgi:hypothetical protein